MKTEFYFREIIMGGSLESLMYSFINETPIILKDPLVPFNLERFDQSYDLRVLGFEDTRSVFKSEVWDRLSFLLSMNGIILYPNVINNIREENKSRFITTKDRNRIKVTYSKKVEFDKILDDEVNVYDWFDVRTGSVHEHRILTDPQSKFIEKVFFYSSHRIGVNGGKKDAVAKSVIKSSDLLNYDKSEGYARLKVLKMMKESGIRGASNGYNKSGYQLFYSPKIEHSHREIVKNYKPLYTMRQILKKRTKRGSLWKLAERLFPQKQITTSPGSSRLRDYI